jgi:DNA-binding transcriptional LysR family regulator
MPSHLELRQLRYFVAVAEELNFRRAADRLSITQPPLSRQVQALEDAVGARLMVRGRTGAALTPAGQAFLGEARDILARVERLVSQTRAGASARAEVRIGITTVVDAAQFNWLAPALHAVAPGITLRVERQISKKSVADVRRGALDLAIIGLPSATDGLAVEVLAVDPLVAAVSASHALARRRRIALAELNADAMFWFDRPLNPAYFDHFGAVFRQLGYAPRRLKEPADHHVLLGLIADGQGTALIPSSLTAIVRAGVVYKTLKESSALKIDIAVAHAAGPLTPATQQVLTLLRRHANAMAPARPVKRAPRPRAPR